MAGSRGRSWERRLSSSPDQRMLEFVQSLKFDWRLCDQDIRGSIAHARMLAKRGLISKADLRAIEKGLKRIAQKVRSGGLVFDKSQEDIHMAIEQALVEEIGEPALRLHTGRSRNDQVATDLRLWVRDCIRRIQTRIAALQRALVGLASRYVRDIMPLYTHMQRAQPASVAAYVLSFVEPLERDYARLENCLDMVDCCPLGSGAIAGTSLEIDRQMTARELGFSRISRNSIDAVADRDFAVEFIFDCAMISVHLSRLANDWILLASTEFGFLRIEDAFCTSSSMMPQKRNPDALELIRGKSAAIQGELVAILSVLRPLTSGYNRDLQQDKVHVFRCADTVQACLEMAADVVGATAFLPRRIAEGLDEGFLDATSLAEYLVLKGIPFRQAHAIVGQLVAECEAQGTRLADLPLERFKQACELVDGDVYRFLGPTNVARAYRSFGAAGPRQAAWQIAYWRRVLKRR